MSDKHLIWIGSSLDDLRSLPESARRRAGFELRSVQRGEAPSDFKPMSSVGAGVREIRIRAGGAYRVFYVVRFSEAVYVLHAFQKKTQRTAPKDLALGKQRYAELLDYRKNSLAP